MITGILIGIGAMFVLGALVSLADPEGRALIAEAFGTIILVPVIPFYLVLRKVMNSQNFQARFFSSETLRRFVNSNAYGGVIVHRRGRAFIVLTDPKVFTGKTEAKPGAHRLKETA
jgi:hypothetical protein